MATANNNNENNVNNEILATINATINAAGNNIITADIAAAGNNMEAFRANHTPAKTAEIEAAITALKEAVKTVKSEMLSPRAIVRAVRDTMITNAEIAALAAKIGVTPQSNKKAIDAATIKLLALIPYYTETRLDEYNVIVDVVIMQRTSVDGVYIARVCKDIFRLLEAVMLNVDGIHVAVKPGKFYKFNDGGEIEETEKVTISRKTDKEAAKLSRLQKSINETTIEEALAALIGKYGVAKILELVNN